MCPPNEGGLISEFSKKCSKSLIWTFQPNQKKFKIVIWHNFLRMDPEWKKLYEIMPPLTLAILWQRASVFLAVLKVALLFLGFNKKFDWFWIKLDKVGIKTLFMEGTIKYLILPVLASLIKDADSVKVVALMPFRFVRTLAFLPKINLMKKFWTLSCRTKYIQSLFIGPNPWPAV